MTIEVSKQTIGAERTIVGEFNQEWQWQDFLTAVENSNELLDDGRETLCLIFNTSDQGITARHRDQMHHR